MNLSKILGKDDTFYRLLNASAKEAQTGAATLSRLVAVLGSSPTEQLQKEIDQSRSRHKQINRQITKALFDTFATPLEREDIEALSGTLYKLSKSTEKIGDRLVLGPPNIRLDSISRQIALLEQGTAVLAGMVGELQSKNHAQSISDGHEKIQGLEGEADRLMNESLRELYHSKDDACVVVFWKDMYELVETAIDRTRDAAGRLFEIVLKNS